MVSVHLEVKTDYIFKIFEWIDENKSKKHKLCSVLETVRQVMETTVGKLRKKS